MKYEKLNDKDWLTTELDSKSYRLVAKEVGCSYSAIVHACKRFGIKPGNGPKQTTHIRVVHAPKPKVRAPRKFEMIPKEKIVELYVEKGLSAQRVTKELNVNLKTLMRAIALHGISVRGHESKNEFLRDKKWLRGRYVDDKRSVSQIAAEIGATRGAVISVMHGAGIPMRSVSEGIVASRDVIEINHPHWGGGRCMMGQDGRYVGVYAPNHPAATKRGYVMEHRLVMEAHIGRYLTPDEIVHHLDGDTYRNTIDNLELTTKKKHFQNHFNAVKYVKSASEENASLQAENESLKKRIAELEGK